ncbi:12048_t:CDS:1, partial [Gigaspora rosea]
MQNSSRNMDNDLVNEGPVRNGSDDYDILMMDINSRNMDNDLVNEGPVRD